MNLIQSIKEELKQAAKLKQKSAMFHYQVLINANELADYNPIEFCKLVDMPETFKTEFRKMMNLARVMNIKGHKL